MISHFFRRRVLGPILDLLRQGITPEKIALSIAFGIVLGVFPALGWTTLLCLVAAAWLRLNLPAMQLVNFLVYPVQLLLLVPFIRAGEMLFRSHPMGLSLPQIVSLIHAGMWHAIKFLWVATVHGIVVWMILAPLAIFLLYRVLAPLLRRAGEMIKSKTAPSALEVC
jgi:uncharacterized protein (DUF2062 family)